MSASQVVQWKRICLPIQETWVQSLGWEDPLEKEMATHSSILAWKTSWIEEPGRLQSIESQRVRHDWSDLASMHVWCTLTFCVLFFQFYFILFYWSIVDLQYHVVAGVQHSHSILHTHTHTYTYVYTHTHILFQILFLIGYYKILSMALCYSVGLFCYLFYIQ